jgi:hypothetical protein
MYRKYIYAIMLTALMAIPALADGGFFGTVTYTGKDCDCVLGDKVAIQPSSGGVPTYIGIDHLHHPHGYFTSPTTFASGNYKIWVVLDNGTKCYSGYVQYIQHSDQNQEVNLTVVGAEEQQQ